MIEKCLTPITRQYSILSPWEYQPVIAQVAADANGLLGGSAESGLFIDESSMPKKGRKSVGVARQWCGRLGKVENCRGVILIKSSSSGKHTCNDRIPLIQPTNQRAHLI